jgi:hypothetical protein
VFTDKGNEALWNENLLINDLANPLKLYWIKLSSISQDFYDSLFHGQNIADPFHSLQYYQIRITRLVFKLIAFAYILLESDKN